ncbi:hypothetical protein Q8W71_13980 [Methylobacterium sp. NEAU 140]|uniref:hypothetical protein n=1 Tax=Methylobacterium sp. NEAU 140 TaxID=3064945 RepID=UPI002732CD82|nr:hypothetical protein [Methylobacterium sp. NEAU 140]MDP4023740.1 hypothetical protein [Methylobacterium sp. NEAU 140]
MSDVIFRSIKETVKRALPRQEIERAKRLIWARQIQEARHALNCASSDRPWLTEPELDALCRTYPVKKEWTQTEGRPDFARARSALRALGGRNGPQTNLDVGGSPGYVARAAALMGHKL